MDVVSHMTSFNESEWSSYAMLKFVYDISSHLPTPMKTFLNETTYMDKLSHLFVPKIVMFIVKTENEQK